jgi:hypothetical protein
LVARKKRTLARKAANGWKRPFNDPIPLPRGRQLVTLEDAGRYIMKLPKAEHEAAGRNGSFDLGGDVGRPDDVYSQWHHASAKPPRRARVQSGQEGPSFGPPKAIERPVTGTTELSPIGQLNVNAWWLNIVR